MMHINSGSVVWVVESVIGYMLFRQIETLTTVILLSYSLVLDVAYVAFKLI